MSLIHRHLKEVSAILKLMTSNLKLKRLIVIGLLLEALASLEAKYPEKTQRGTRLIPLYRFFLFSLPQNL